MTATEQQLSNATGTPTVQAELSALTVGTPGKLGILRFNRPEKRNALRAQEAFGIAAGVDALLAAGARAILITGNGPVFCAGADLSGGVYTDEFWDGVAAMLTAVTEAPVPVIADVFGPAVGAGCQLMLACDLRFFGSRGECWIPSAEHGFALDEWTHGRAVELMGGAWARNLFLGGDHLKVGDACRIGLAMDARGEAVERRAAEIAGQAPLSMQHSKLVLNMSLGPAVARGRKRVAAQERSREQAEGLFHRAWHSEDVLEARAARTEKRRPRFQGR